MKLAISITLNEDIIRFIDSYSKDHDLNRSATIERLISYFLISEETYHFKGLNKNTSKKELTEPLNDESNEVKSMLKAYDDMED